jgi:hypothetical protein
LLCITANIRSTRSRVAPARCKAAMVFSKVGASRLATMASISAFSSSIPACRAAG